MAAPFNIDDVLVRVDGQNLSGGFKRATVEHIDLTNEKCWLNTGTYIRFEEAAQYKVVRPVSGVSNQAFKADAGKPRWSLLMTGCASAVAGVVRVLTFAVNPVSAGGKGYVPNSWKEVPNATERYKDALHRHLNKIELGETHDDESGELHWNHVATNALFLAELNKDTPNANSN